jgi:hypothetical protein
MKSFSIWTLSFIILGAAVLVFNHNPVKGIVENSFGQGAGIKAIDIAIFTLSIILLASGKKK